MPHKILIVDDDQQVSLALSIRLKASGYEAAVSHDGETALAKMAGYMPDIVLLDIRMPGIDGFEVIRRMKEDAQLANIPVIFVSANAQETAKRAALSAGGRYFLEKPFDSKVLLSTIELVLKEDSKVSGAS